MFDLNLGNNARSVSVVASRMVSPRVAKVVVSYAGNVDCDFVQQEIARMFNGQASVVESSFRPMNCDGYAKMASCFIRANREIRMPSQKELKASYRVLSSNVLMSNEDRTLWEVKKGANTTYLTRHSNDDLSHLLDLVTANSHPRSSVTTALSASVVPEKYDLVAFVNALGDLDVGFVMASNSESTKVVSYASKKAVIVSNASIVDSRECKIDPQLVKAVKRKVEADTKDGSISDMETYYKALYSYDTQYMQEVLDAVRDLGNTLA